MMVVALVGGFTAILAATIGIKQMDIKKVLAYSTVSQLGYMVMACGVGAFASGIFHLMTHAFFKALLFLGSGAVIHSMHGALHHVHDHNTDPQDMRNMGGLRKYIPLTYWLFVIATIAIAGIPGFSGFFSKDEILAGAFATGMEGNAYGYFVWFLGLAAAIITAFYMFRLVYLTFHGDYKGPKDSDQGLKESPPVMTVPLIVLAVLSIIGGYVGLPPVVAKTHIFQNWLHPVFEPAMEAVHAHHHHLSHSTEWVLIFVSVAAAVIGIAIAWSMYIKKSKIAKSDAEQAGFGKVLFNKYYVDEIYAAVIIRPLLGLCNISWRVFDMVFIDSGLVLGTAKVVHWIGGGVRRLQTGVVPNYALFLALGIVVILVTLIAR